MTKEPTSDGAVAAPEETMLVSPAAHLPRQREKLAHLDAADFAHPQDRQAMAALSRLKGFDFAVGKLIEWQHERGAHVHHSATSVRVTSRQLPRIHGLLIEACEILDMEEPELYIAGGGVNALTSGHNNPYIVLYSGVVEAMSDLELQAVIAHELGHIKCSHVLYKEMVRWITDVGVQNASRTPQGAIKAQTVLRIFRSTLISWDQKSELSADRAAMLVARDEDICVRMLLKLAGAPARLTAELDTQAFLDQARHLQDLTFASRIADSHRRQMVAGASHPLTVERARLLDAWVHDGGYQKVLAEPGAALQAQANDARAQRRRRGMPRIQITFRDAPEQQLEAVTTLPRVAIDHTESDA